MAGRAILDLDTLTNRPVVVIDGQEYELLTNDVMPPIDSHRIARMGRRLDALMTKSATSELTAEEETELEELPGRMCGKVLVADADVIARLKPRQQMAILATFLRGPLYPPMAAAATAAGRVTRPDPPPPPPADERPESSNRTRTGATSSPGSSASTAETR